VRYHQPRRRREGGAGVRTREADVCSPHSYPPHPPFVYAPDCSIRSDIVYDIVPLRDCDVAGMTESRQLYADSVGCVSRQLVFFAREIAQRDPVYEDHPQFGRLHEYRLGGR
jgi:hypothetical protein